MNILEMAQKIVDGDREQTYGDPAKNMRNIAALWTAWLRARGWNYDGQLMVPDIACMMTLMKLARLANHPTHLDSQVDIAGYMYAMSRTQQPQGGKGGIE